MPTDAVSEIRAAIERWAHAVHEGDVAAAMTQYVPDVTTFDLEPPLEKVGVATAERRLREWLASYRGKVDYDVTDLHIATSTDLAVCHSLNHVRGELKNGQRVDMWVRVTLAMKKVAADWKVIHEHVSVPFDMTTFKAVLDLTP